MSKQPAPKKPSSAIINVIPNNYEEQPSVIDGKQRLYKDKVAAAVDELDSLGKFITIFQVCQPFLFILVFVCEIFFKSNTHARQCYLCVRVCLFCTRAYTFFFSPSLSLKCFAMLTHSSL